MLSRSGLPLEVRELRYGYGRRETLCGVSLDAAPGEVVGLIGPNGSGKSTLVRVASAVLPGYRGSVRIGDDEIRDLPRRQLARRMAVVPQEVSFSFPFTVLQVVLMGRHPHLAGLAFESEQDVELARQALARCGAAEFASRSIHELSSGERQQVVFARALAQQPRVLLLDEPASFLDVRHQMELYDRVRELAADQGTTVLTVLHDLNLAAEYCDRVYLLRDGRIAASGATDVTLTYANLKAVFDTEVYVDLNSVTGKLLIVPLSGRARNRLQ